MSTVGNVSVGKPKTTGAIFVAPSGTTPPTDATTALASAFKDLGFVSEDGVTNNNSTDSDTITAWGGQVVLTVGTETTDEFTFTLIEVMNSDVLSAVYGTTSITAGTNTIAVAVKGNDAAEKVFVIEVAMTNNAMKRIVIPHGKIKEMGEIVYKDDEPIGYELTISALPDTSGNTHYEYIKLA